MNRKQRPLICLSGQTLMLVALGILGVIGVLLSSCASPEDTAATISTSADGTETTEYLTGEDFEQPTTAQPNSTFSPPPDEGTEPFSSANHPPPAEGDGNPNTGDSTNDDPSESGEKESPTFLGQDTEISEAAQTSNPSAETEPVEIGYRLITEGIGFPIFLTAIPGETWSYLATKEGRIYILEAGRITNTALDITARAQSHGEQGLLGLAIHPSQPDRLFVHYTATSPNLGDTLLVEYRIREDRTIDPESEVVLLQLSQPASNHNGGMIQFTSDGLLWMGLGDGGGANDQFGHGQNPDSLLATIIRIDPSIRPYQIPPDNPFVGGGGAPEVWGWGLRNPWRFWIDEPEGYFYIADVGQDSFEEINVVPLSAEGPNFGWPITEGHHCFATRKCDPTGTILPPVDLDHINDGTCSVTGGVVYRGSGIPQLFGHYLYSDYCGGYLRSFRWEDNQVKSPTDWTPQVGKLTGVVSFGVDGTGEVYVLTDSEVYRLEAQP